MRRPDCSKYTLQHGGALETPGFGGGGEGARTPALGLLIELVVQMELLGEETNDAQPFWRRPRDG